MIRDRFAYFENYQKKLKLQSIKVQLLDVHFQASSGV